MRCRVGAMDAAAAVGLAFARSAAPRTSTPACRPPPHSAPTPTRLPPARGLTHVFGARRRPTCPLADPRPPCTSAPPCISPRPHRPLPHPPSAPPCARRAQHSTPWHRLHPSGAHPQHPSEPDEPAPYSGAGTTLCGQGILSCAQLVPQDVVFAVIHFFLEVGRLPAHPRPATTPPPPSSPPSPILCLPTPRGPAACHRLPRARALRTTPRPANASPVALAALASSRAFPPTLDATP